MENYEVIKKAVTEAMQEQMKDFYIDREKHYQHHEFIDNMMKWSNSWKSTCLKAICELITVGAIALLVMGFIAWGKNTLK